MNTVSLTAATPQMGGTPPYLFADQARVAFMWGTVYVQWPGVGGSNDTPGWEYGLTGG